MNNITEHIKNRRSVRTFDERVLAKADVEKLASFTKTILKKSELLLLL